MSKKRTKKLMSKKRAARLSKSEQSEHIGGRKYNFIAFAHGILPGLVKAAITIVQRATVKQLVKSSQERTIRAEISTR